MFYHYDVRIREKVKAFTHPTRSRGRYLRVLYLGLEGRLRDQLRAQHSVRSDGSSQTNKQISAQSEFKLPNSDKVHSLMKILIGDKTTIIEKYYKNAY
jgi:hypothetical protein